MEKLTRRSIPRKGIYKAADIFLYEVGCFILSGIDKEGVLQSVELAVEMDNDREKYEEEFLCVGKRRIERI